MYLDPKRHYSKQEITPWLQVCPACQLSDQLALHSSIKGDGSHQGTEGISCSRCNVELVFGFQTTMDHEIIDRWQFQHCKLGSLEFRAHEGQVVLYWRNHFVREIAEQIVDLEQYRGLLALQ